MKIKRYLEIYWSILKLSIWTVARIVGYWRNNRQLTFPIIIGVNNSSDVLWWDAEIKKIQKKRLKFEAKL